jgi:uncharacterized peroxidase-related enzyme
MMSRIQPVDHEQAVGKTRGLLDAVKAKLGMAPNMMKTMAQSPAVLEAYLSFGGALEAGKLNPRVREQIALITAEVNRCDYCAAAHTAIGRMVGLDEAGIWAARQGQSSDEKTDAALKFARALILSRGEISDAEVTAVREAGFSDGEIVEILAHVALNIFTNYFNLTAGTEIDFPKVRS